jgi:hypothetical protein
MNTLNRSALKMKNGLPYFEVPEIAKIHWVRHAFLTRKGGSSPSPYDSLNVSEDNGDEMKEVARNRRRVANAFEFDEKNLFLLDQVHQDQILLLKEDGLPPPPRNYDALITARSPFLGILTADCIPIFRGSKETGGCGHPRRETGDSSSYYQEGVEEDGRRVRMCKKGSSRLFRAIHWVLLL